VFYGIIIIIIISISIIIIHGKSRTNYTT